MFSVFRKQVTVQRPAPTTRNVSGFVSPPSYSEFTITASVQSSTGEDINLLPEGYRRRGVYRLYTNDTLNAADERDGRNGDIVLINGSRYLVVAHVNWDNGLIPHEAYLCTRLNDA